MEMCGFCLTLTTCSYDNVFIMQRRRKSKTFLGKFVKEWESLIVLDKHETFLSFIRRKT